MSTATASIRAPELRRADIDQIAALPSALAAAVAGLSDAQLDQQVEADPWTIRQIVHHIADSHMNAFIRMKLLLSEEYPTLRPYDQDAWSLLPDNCSMPLAATLALLQALHERWAYMLERLDEGAWARSGFHPDSGTVTLDSLLRSYAEHGQDHIAQLKRILG